MNSIGAAGCLYSEVEAARRGAAQRGLKVSPAFIFHLPATEQATTQPSEWAESESSRSEENFHSGPNKASLSTNELLLSKTVRAESKPLQSHRGDCGLHSFKLHISVFFLIWISLEALVKYLPSALLLVEPMNELMEMTGQLGHLL